MYLPVQLQCHYLKRAYTLVHGPVKKDGQACGGICNTSLILFKSWRLLRSPCPKGGPAQWLCWKESSPSAWSSCEHGLTFPEQFPFPTQFYSVLYRALFHKGAFQQCPAKPAGWLNKAGRECAQLNAVTIRWEAARQILHCNSFVLPRLPAFHGLGKINESKLFCPKHNSHHF